MSGAAVCLSFELDADLFWLAIDPSAHDRPKTLSLGRYAITRGIDRVLSILRDAEVPSTWFVPGLIVDREPEAIAKLTAAGCELGSRAWGPGGLAGQSMEQQKAEIQRGISALHTSTGRLPQGFRAPTGEVDENTFIALSQLGVSWSSCLRSGEAPRRITFGDNTPVIDIGYRWELTDYAHFQFNFGPAYPRGQTRIASYSAVLSEWCDDVAATLSAGEPCVFTLSPDVIGKPGRALILRRLIDFVKDNGYAFSTVGSIAGC